MHKSMRSLVLSLLLILLLGAAAVPEQRSSVELIKSVDLPGYSGDFDHFAADYDRHRLLLAAEDHGTLEVFDLKTSDHLRTVAGFGNPHSILVRKGVATVFITDSTKENATIRDATTYAKKQAVNLTPGSDTAKYDAAFEYPLRRDRRQGRGYEDSQPRGHQSRHRREARLHHLP